MVGLSEEEFQMLQGVLMREEVSAVIWPAARLPDHLKGGGDRGWEIECLQAQSREEVVLFLPASG